MIDRIYSAGPDASCYNLVVVAERATSPSQAAGAARSLLARLTLEPWWVRVKTSVNVLAISETRDFRSYSPRMDGRLVLWDIAGLREFVTRAGVPNPGGIGLAIHDLGRGGGGLPGQFAFSTTELQWESLLLHEFGHCCGLGDEYSPAGGTWTQGEPPWQNLTIERDRTKIKWRARFNPANVAIPTLSNSMMMHPPIPPGAIGLFEGGGTSYANGIFRPSQKCRMLGANTDPFCIVCEDAIVQHLTGGRLDPPPPPPPPPPEKTGTFYWSDGAVTTKMIPTSSLKYVLRGTKLFVQRLNQSEYDEQNYTVVP